MSWHKYCVDCATFDADDPLPLKGLGGRGNPEVGAEIRYHGESQDYRIDYDVE